MTPRELELLAQKLSPAIRRAFLQAVEASQRAATIQLVTDLVTAGRVDALLEALGFDDATVGDLTDQVYAALNADPVVMEHFPSTLTPSQSDEMVDRMSAGWVTHGYGLWAVEVRDSGEGIPKEHLPHVFDRYWTVKEGNPTGTGLGLYITQGIVEAHGGRIFAESEPGQGSEFRFTVPRLD